MSRPSMPSATDLSCRIVEEVSMRAKPWTYSRVLCLMNSLENTDMVYQEPSVWQKTVHLGLEVGERVLRQLPNSWIRTWILKQINWIILVRLLTRHSSRD